MTTQFMPGDSLVEIDRLKTCPLLIRVFPKANMHNDARGFQRRGQEPPNEFQIYTWMDATLREITELVQQINSFARKRDAVLKYAFVYPDKRGQMIMRQVGDVHSFKKGNEDGKTLRQLDFQIGDYLDVAICSYY